MLFFRWRQSLRRFFILRFEEVPIDYSECLNDFSDNQPKFIRVNYPLHLIIVKFSQNCNLVGRELKRGHGGWRPFIVGIARTGRRAEFAGCRSG